MGIKRRSGTTPKGCLWGLNLGGSRPLWPATKNRLRRWAIFCCGRDPLGDLGAAAATTTGFAIEKNSTGTIWFDDIRLTNESTSTSLRNVLADNLGSTNVVTDQGGNVIETLSYYPFGGIRLDNATSSYSGNQRKYIGQMYDGQTGLNLSNSRYQNPNQGQFLSQDPVFLGIPNQQHLNDPQSLNAYSYSEDNPVTKSDPNGRDTYDFNFAYAVPTPWGFSVGPSFDYDVTPGNYSNPYIGAGIIITGMPGPSGGITYSQSNPSTGLSASLSYFPVGAGGQGSVSQGANGKPDFSAAGGVTNGYAAFNTRKSITGGISLTLQLSQWNSLLLGPFQNVTTLSGGYSSYLNSNPIITRSPQVSGSTSQGQTSSGSGGGGFNIGQQNRAATYTFSGGVNAYGQTFNQVFGK